MAGRTGRSASPSETCKDGTLRLDHLVTKTSLTALALALVLGFLAVSLSGRELLGPVSAPRPLSIDHPYRKTGVPPVRVRLAEASGRTTTIRIDGPYRVHPVSGWQTLAEGDKLASQPVTVLPYGFKIGASEFRVTRLEIEPVRHPTLWVGAKLYRGGLRLIRQSDGSMLAINVVDLEDYIASMVNGETPSDFPTEARRAQAIAGRTYVLYQMKTAGRGREYDVFDDTRSQVYEGVQHRTGGRVLASESAEGRMVAEDTRGVVAVYRGRLFCAYYSAICGGRTVDGRAVFGEDEPPVFVPVPCDWCAGSKYYRWSADIPRRTVEDNLRRNLRARGTHIGTIRQLAAAGSEAGAGPASTIRIVHSGGQTTLTARDFRLHSECTSQLRSDRYTLEDRGEKVHFEGRGWGHGVGLCQWGARGQALAGRDCVRILQHYYPGAELVAVY